MTVHGAKGLEAPIVFLPDTCTTATGGPVDARSSISTAWSCPRASTASRSCGASRAPAGTPPIAARQAERTRARDRGAQPAALRRHDARARPALRRRLRGQEGQVGRLLVRADHRGAAATRFRRRSGPTARRCAAASSRKRRRRSRARARRSRRRRSPRAGLGVQPGAARAGAVASRWRRRGSKPTRPMTTASRSSSSRAASAAQRGAAGAAARRASARQPLPARNADARPAAAPADAAAARRGTRRRPAISTQRGQRPPASARARTSPRRRLPSCGRPSSHLCSARRAAPRCRSSRSSPTPSARDRRLKLIGQIDRLVDLGDEVLIVDYKTNRPPPPKVEQVAAAYLFQLAAYRLALREIYAGRRVKAALLWTDGPRIMAIPDALLDQYTARLWDLDVSHLDAGGGSFLTFRSKRCRPQPRRSRIQRRTTQWRMQCPTTPSSRRF